MIKVKNPKKVLNLIRKTSFLLGYQSGLNVLACNEDVKNLMLMFAQYAPKMCYTFCKKEQIKKRFGLCLLQKAQRKF